MDTDPTTPLDPPPAPSAPPRQLLRTPSEDRVLGGVAAGLGRYFAVDPILFRIGFAVTAFVGGTGICAYLALLLFVPADDGSADPQAILRPTRRTFVLGGAAAVAAVGGVVLALAGAWATAVGAGA
ncbi:MAG: PspC protein, partial [Solirubrobacterales bacterium]|nr:PspC protein [Solirubrobacterales bacterium]